jgi:phage shock protein PspC (stress-responsive transcriptional regulator)
MNKVVNINLNGIIISIDEVAYEQLKQYIDDLHKHFSGTEGSAEIISDIETRIAELLQLKITDNSTVILSKDVADVISVMGNPWQMEGEEERQSSNQSSTQNNTQNTVVPKKLKRDPHNKVISGVCGGLGNFLNIDPIIARAGFLISFFIFGSGLFLYLILWVIMPEASPDELPQFSGTSSRKLFRNTDDKMIGGVCSGIGAYLGVSEVVMRVVFLISFFAFGTGLLAYIILWIIIPEAKTAAEKLQMRGSSIDINNIEREIRNTTSNLTNKATTSPVLKNVLKVVTIIAGLLVLLVIVLPGSILFLVLTFGMNGSGDFSDFVRTITINDTILMLAKWGIIAIIFSVLLSFSALAFQLITHKKPKYITLITTILFFGGIASSVVALVMYRSEIKHEVILITNEQELAVNDTLLIKLNPAFLDDDVDEFDFHLNDGEVSWKIQNDMLLFKEPHITINTSANNLMQVKLKRESWGKTQEEAEQLARKASLNLVVDSSKVILDNGVGLGNEPFKNQELTLGLWIPAGTILKVQYEALEMIKDKILEKEVEDLEETPYVYLKVTDEGVECLTCDGSNWTADTKIEIEEIVTDSISNDKKTKVNTTIKKIGPITIKKSRTVEIK